ncbi:MAG: hypothetical protein GXO65_07595 [Euryarchaeota archaeon]|nr:hypothetical protein [Euryarchaeota archaeon]
MERKIAFLLRDEGRFRQSEFSRSSLGMLLAGHEVHVFVLDVVLQRNPYIDENLEWIVDAGGRVYSNNEENAADYIEYISDEDLPQRLLEADFIVPF